jgi:uncharacterized membrane protein
MRSRTRLFLVWVAAVFYFGAGFLHIVRPAPYLKIMVSLSGAAEIAGGMGLTIPRLRRAAAWGVVALLIAVFPTNIYMAMSHIQINVRPLPDAVLWQRLLLQPVLIWWVLASTSPATVR